MVVPRSPFYTRLSFFFHSLLNTTTTFSEICEILLGICRLFFFKVGRVIRLRVTGDERWPVLGVQTGVQMVGSELNRTRGKQEEKKRGEQRRFLSCQFFARTPLSERLEQARRGG